MEETDWSRTQALTTHKWLRHRQRNTHSVLTQMLPDWSKILFLKYGI